MAVRKLSGGYYTRKGDYIWVWVVVQPRQEGWAWDSGWVEYLGASNVRVTTEHLKGEDRRGVPRWKKADATVWGMSGAEFRFLKWRKVKADKVPLVWRKFLNRFK